MAGPKHKRSWATLDVYNVCMTVLVDLRNLQIRDDDQVAIALYRNIQLYASSIFCRISAHYVFRFPFPAQVDHARQCR